MIYSKMNKQQYTSQLKELDIEKIPLLDWPNEKLPYNTWVYFDGLIYWKQKADYIDWSIRIFVSNGLIGNVIFSRERATDIFEMNDKVAKDSINALKPYFKKSVLPLVIGGVGIVVLLIILKKYMKK